MSINIRSCRMRSRRVRMRIKNSFRLRISVFRSNRHFYVQVIDDARGETLLAASSLELKNRDSSTTSESNVNASSVKMVANLMIDKFKKMDLSEHKYVFDRGPYPYHGNIKLFSECLRNAGIEF